MTYLDNEPVQKHDTYVKKHVFDCFEVLMERKSTLISADINGSANIIRKVFSNAFADGIQGVVVPPKQMNPLKAEFFSM